MSALENVQTHTRTHTPTHTNHQITIDSVIKFILNVATTITYKWFSNANKGNVTCNLTFSSSSAPGSRQLVFIVYYLVLSFLLMYSFEYSGLSTDVFPNKTNINTHTHTPHTPILLIYLTLGLLTHL